MNIVIIGTGNVAFVLAKKLYGAGHLIVQVYGRNEEAARALADAVGAAGCSAWSGITNKADLYLIALADKAVNAKDITLKLADQLVVHTAGAVPMNTLQQFSSSYGVLYPLQTIRKEVEPLPEIPLLIDANTNAARETLMALGRTISQNVRAANDAERLQYHLCAVMANNFSNYLYVLAETYCKKHGLDFKILLPLIDETAGRLHRFSPQQVQTGPAIRKDQATVDLHLTLLAEEPALKALYQLFSHAILQYPW